MIAIYGAGLAGLLAGNMLRSLRPHVWEAQEELPNNHSALLRFRTDKVGTACAIPFKKVRVQKAIWYDGKLHTQPNLMLSNLYSQKVTDAILNRSINNLDPVERYIAPLDVISQMAGNCDITYGSALDMDRIEQLTSETWSSDIPAIVSTIPMPVLMKILGWQDIPEFPSQQIWTLKATIDEPDCDVYQTIYYPDPTSDVYRISIIGNVVISEFIRKPQANIGPHISEALREHFGIKPRKLVDLKESHQYYGKIRPIDEELRKEFIFEATSKYNIYSVGRFATWRQLLLDDVVEDIQHVEKFIRTRSNYSRMLHVQKGADNES